MRYKLLRNILLLISALLLVTSCQDYKKLQFKSYNIEKVNNLSFKKGSVCATLTFNIDVVNPSSTTFKAKDLEAIIYSSNGEPFAQLTSEEEAIIPANNDGPFKWNITTELFNPLSFLASNNFSLDNLDVENMTIDYSLVFSGGFKKKLTGKGVLLEDLIRAFQSTSPDSHSQ